MAIKQLEKDNGDKSLIIKFIAVFCLLITGVIVSRLPIKKPLDSKILGAESKAKSAESKQDFQEMLDQGMDKTKDTLDDVLGEATSLIVATASKSAEAITDFVYDNTVGSLVKQINKLPEKQQQEIRERVCK